MKRKVTCKKGVCRLLSVPKQLQSRGGMDASPDYYLVPLRQGAKSTYIRKKRKRQSGKGKASKTKGKNQVGKGRKLRSKKSTGKKRKAKKKRSRKSKKKSKKVAA
jgi:hypothetical protein